MNPNKIKILAVDDEPRNLRAIEAILVDFNLDIVTAGSGPEALRHLLNDDFALVLLDIQMPGMTGIELAGLIRQRERSGRTPIIFQSASWKTDEMIFKGYSTGAVDYLIKPIVPEILRAKVNVFVELAVARQELEGEIRQRRRAQAEVGQLNRELQRQNLELKATNQALEAFSYSVSHDLRAPLRHINGFAEILEQSVGPTMEPEKRRLLNIIRESATHMDRLVEGLLDFSRSGRAVMKRTTIDLNQLVQDTQARLRPEMAGRDIAWHLDPLPAVEGDATLIGQVLTNLFSNAIKYTRPRSQARIVVTNRQCAGELIISIADNGVGFDMNYADKLFGVFQRMHRAQEFEGTGIGLANVRRIIERHGGRTWAEAIPDQGATFHFSLPLPTDATPEQSNETPYFSRETAPDAGRPSRAAQPVPAGAAVSGNAY